MATTICVRVPTRTSVDVRTSLGVGATLQKVVYTIPGRTVLVPFTTTKCVTRLSVYVDCATFVTSRSSVSPAHLETNSITLHVQRTSYITSYSTLYSTSCSVSRPPTPPTPIPVTTYVTIGTTTTRTSVLTTQTSVLTPSQSTVGPSSGSGIVPTDIPITADGGITGSKKVPTGAIVGGVLGGLVAAALIGFLVYMLMFKKSKRNSQDSSREHLDRRLSTVDGHSSPSEGSSGVLHPQMQEHGPRYSNLYSDQGYQYAHVRQDSQTMPVPVGGGQSSPIFSPYEQGIYHPRGSQYVGHAEIQDSRF